MGMNYFYGTNENENSTYFYGMDGDFFFLGVYGM